MKPYLSRQKNDFNDAEAIAEAGSRACTRFVPLKSQQQRELEGVQCVRRRLVRNRTALMNQVRGILAEHGKVLRQGRSSLMEYLSSGLEELSEPMRELLYALYEELKELQERIVQAERMLSERGKACTKPLRTVPGIGILGAVALFTASGDAREFKNGRQFAANLGLVPRQFSTGGKTKLGKISRCGDSELRSLLIVGAHAVIRQAVGKKKEDAHSLWIRKLCSKKDANLAAVALANKNARIAWRLLTEPGQEYQPELAH